MPRCRSGLIIGAIVAAVALTCAVIAAPSNTIVSGPLRFEENLILGDYGYAFGIAAADLDGDGDLDLTSSDTCLLYTSPSPRD